MPDKTPLPPELFQFTNEEVALMPEAIDILLPPHIKIQQAAGASHTAAHHSSTSAPSAAATAPIVALSPSSLAGQQQSTETAANTNST